MYRLFPHKLHSCLAIMWPHSITLSLKVHWWRHPNFLSQNSKSIIFSATFSLFIAFLIESSYITHAIMCCKPFFWGQNMLSKPGEKAERRNVVLPPWLWDWIFEHANDYGCKGFSDTIKKIVDMERMFGTYVHMCNPNKIEKGEQKDAIAKWDEIPGKTA